MKLWLTAQEFADLATACVLPGLPTTKAGVLKMIRRDGWDHRRNLARPRSGRAGGGGTEYHVDNLPLSARVALAARHFRIQADDLRPAVMDDDGLSARAREIRDARLVLLKLADRFRREQSLSVAAADSLFCSLFNASSIELPAWVTASVGRLSARSLARWRTRRDKPNALGFDPAAARRGTGQLDTALDGQVKTFVLAAIAKMPFLSAKAVSDAVSDKFKDAIAAEDFRLPPLRTLQQTLKAWRQDYKNELMLLTDPDGYRSRVEFSATGVIRAERLNEIWMIDASPADVMLHEGRHSIYLTVDVLSRRTKILATPTPRAEAVGLMMRKCLLAWGVPERVLTDNGSDFVAAATQRLFAALGIEAERSQRYDPKSKGKGLVERPIGTFQRDLACLPGFIGHSVADRKRIEGRKAFAQRLGSDEKELFGVDMDLAEFQRWCDDWSDTIYASTEHEGLGKRTPMAVAASSDGAVRRIENVAALDILLAPAPGKDGLRTVTKVGVRIDGAHYLPDTVMPGTTVFCRMDPADLGKVLLFEPDGETFLGEAICPELAGLDPVETIRHVKAAQKAHVDGRIKDIRREMRRIGPRQIADAMRRQGETRAGKLLAFPRPEEPHSTAALAAAADAAAPVGPIGLSDRAAELHSAMIAATPRNPSVEPVPTKVTRLPESREARFRRALDLEQRRQMGERLADADLLWLGGYQNGSEYRAMRAMVEEFGQDAMNL
ncbi:DNA-binding protein [Nitratireductor soli]|uniref:DNA-binding protein n=1 Tax=Nitratireductor soli TaxID=1670619 RepID=UPI0019D06CD8|nr:DDE-type integrase/transposase/recombinase [Nitratireductor soli]